MQLRLDLYRNGCSLDGNERVAHTRLYAAVPSPRFWRNQPLRVTTAQHLLKILSSFSSPSSYLIVHPVDASPADAASTTPQYHNLSSSQ
eukprot:2591795-Prymnesium_polylepis.2